MKATIDLDDALYRRLKVQAALSGRPLKALVAEGVRRVLDTPDSAHEAAQAASRTVRQADQPEWFGVLRKYARNAHGDHSLAAMRQSVAVGRARKAPK